MKWAFSRCRTMRDVLQKIVPEAANVVCIERISMLTARFATERNVGACPRLEPAWECFEAKNFIAIRDILENVVCMFNGVVEGLKNVLFHFQGHLRVDVVIF